MKLKLRNNRLVFRTRDKTRKAGGSNLRIRSWFCLAILCFVVYDLSLPDDEFWYIPPTVEHNYPSDQFPRVSIGMARDARTNKKFPPRVVQVDFDNHNNNAQVSAQPHDNSTNTLMLNRTILTSYYDYGWELGEDPWIDVDPRPECAPLEWQTKRFLSCNSLHEVHQDGLGFVNCGMSRCAFEFIDMTGVRTILKMKWLDRWFRFKELEYARRDSLVMERLTSSPYVASIYGACGTSQIVEYSAHGNLFDWMKLTRHRQRALPTPMEKLKFAVQIATGVADLHSIDHRIVSVSHNDVCCHQFILVDGRFQLGDFHLSTFAKLNTTATSSPTACEEWNKPMNSIIDKVRAPEELEERRITPLDKVDVYLMGNVMYYILTQRWVFQGVAKDETVHQLVAGNRSEFYNFSQHPAEVAVEKAIRWSWTHNPHKRPTARQVSNFLKNALMEHGQEYNTVVRVPNIPPLPPDYDFDDSEWGI